MVVTTPVAAESTTRDGSSADRSLTGTAAHRPPTAVLGCRDLVLTRGRRRAVDGVSFTVNQGEIYGLLGPNGAGKTSTLAMIAGIFTPDSGEVTVAGLRMGAANAEARRAIGFVPQDVALYPDLTGRENMLFFGRLYGLRGGELEGRVDELLDLVGLRERAREQVRWYSGGMKRRCNIAAGLIHRPRLLVLDEPTVGVDPQSRNAILEQVAALAREGVAVVYASHYMEEVRRLCDRIGILDHGLMVAQGTARELEALTAGSRQVEVTTAGGDVAALVVELRAVDSVSHVAAVDSTVTLLTEQGQSLVATVVAAAERHGVTVTGVRAEEPDLEAVFLRLTGTALRD